MRQGKAVVMAGLGGRLKGRPRKRSIRVGSPTTLRAGGGGGVGDRCCFCCKIHDGSRAQRPSGKNRDGGPSLLKTH